MAEQKETNIQIVNRKAKFSYEFIDTFTAGMVLTGTEIKAIRAGNVNLTESFCAFKRGELWVRNLYISEYLNGSVYNHDVTRTRKLLLNKRELARLEKKVKETGVTIIPYKIFFNKRGIAKMEIALARGKKAHDKRQTIKERDDKRAMDRLKKRFR